jgi:hypothetical protein
MKATVIPNEVNEAALRSIERFNRRVLAGKGCSFVPRFQGKYLYLDRDESGRTFRICRLQ